MGYSVDSQASYQRKMCQKAKGLVGVVLPGFTVDVYGGIVSSNGFDSDSVLTLFLS